jgi:hypothetical protein
MFLCRAYSTALVEVKENCPSSPALGVGIELATCHGKPMRLELNITLKQRGFKTELLYKVTTESP